MRWDGARVPTLDSRVVERLCSYRWPYNVREVRQLARLLAASARESCSINDLPERFLRVVNGGNPTVMADDTELAPTAKRYQRWLSQHVAELTRLKDALRSCGGNLSEAARRARIPRHRARRLLAAESRLVEGTPRPSNEGSA